MRNKALSERSLAIETGQSRLSIRALFSSQTNFNIKSLLKVATYFDQNIAIISYSNSDVDSTTTAVSYRILRDGFNSWKIHLMNMVDEYRASLDIRIFLLPPAKESDERILALMASVVDQLCFESKVATPHWAQKTYFLQQPWFLSETESLKAFAILESPIAFKKNNIFVLDNFLMRA